MEGQAAEDGKQECEHAKSVAPAVHATTIDPEFVKEMLLGIARSWNGERVELEATLPAELKAGLEADAEGAVKALLAEGVEVGYSEKVKSGFKVAPKDGGYYTLLQTRECHPQEKDAIFSADIGNGKVLDIFLLHTGVMVFC